MAANATQAELAADRSRLPALSKIRSKSDETDLAHPDGNASATLSPDAASKRPLPVSMLTAPTLAPGAALLKSPTIGLERTVTSDMRLERRERPRDNPGL